MLVIKIDAEKNKDNYKAVLAALADFDVVSAAWETDTPQPTSPDIKSGRSGDGLSSAVSAAVKLLSEQQKGNRG